MPNNGKYLEKMVDKYFTDLKETGVVHCRLTDSKAARNKIAANNADFLCSTLAKGAMHIECKSIGSKNWTLKKFAQFALMRRWALAGTPGYVLVHFYNLEAFSVVSVGELDPLAASWKIHGSRVFISFEEAMEWILGGVR